MVKGCGDLFEVNKKTLYRVFFGAAGCIILYWLLNERENVKQLWNTVLDILAPFIIGGCFAFVANVPMRFFENKLIRIQAEGLRRAVALILTFVAIAIVLGGVVLLLIPQLVETVEMFVPAVYEFLLDAEVHINEILQKNPEALELFSKFGGLDFATIIQKIMSVFGSSVATILQSAVSTIGSVASFAMDFFVAIVFAVYCLFQKETLARQGRKLLYAFTKEHFADEVIHILRLSNSTFSNFISGQCIEVCILGGMVAVSMAALKMPYIPLVSVLVAVTAFIPIVGAWVGCFVGAFFMLVNDPMQAVWFVVMFLVVQQIEGNLIYPKVVGTSIGLSGMWVIVAISVGGDLFGIVGMLLMIPLASVIQTILREKVAVRLSKRVINPDKLQAHPPILKSHLKEKREENKEKREIRRSKRKGNTNK